jgi:hypothetical protein
MERVLAQIQSEIQLQEKFLLLFAALLDQPLFYHSGQFHRGFRFSNPGPKHFCLLKAIRCVSGLNAALVLVRNGYPQELAVLIRTIVECTSYIELILHSLRDGQPGPKEQKFLDDFFADFLRNETSDFKKPGVRQEDVHKSIDRHVDAIIGKSEFSDRYKDVSLKALLSNVYLTYSNYVHSRYPEIMDLYGGEPAKFHLHGMKGTPKDHENIETLKCFTESVSLTLRQMIQKFELRDNIRQVPGLEDWYLAFRKNLL